MCQVELDAVDAIVRGSDEQWSQALELDLGRSEKVNMWKNKRLEAYDGCLRTIHTLMAGARPPVMAEVWCNTPQDIGALRLPKQQFPKFSGQLRDYPTFRDDWKQQIEPALSDADKMIEIRKHVPA